jgi:acetolactate synthase-1/3 small subunit
LVSVYDGRVLDVSPSQVTISVDDVPERVDDFEELLRPYGIANLQRTGRVALPKLDKTGPSLRQVQSQAS